MGWTKEAGYSKPKTLYHTLMIRAKRASGQPDNLEARQLSSGGTMAIKVQAKDCSYKMNIAGNESSIWFALVASHNKVRQQITSWFTCKDYINDVLIAAANEKKHSYYNPGTSIKPDYNRLRILVAANSAVKSSMFAAKRVINLYEDLAGFSKKTVISTVSPMGNLQGGGGTWLFTGPKEWMLCSQLVSMVTLIIRICFRLKMTTKDVPKTLDELDKYWKKSIKEAKLKNEGTPRWYYGKWDIETGLGECYERWRVLMGNFNEIFKDLKTSQLYPVTEVGNWHSPGGILSLCRFVSRISVVDKRFKEACIKAGVVKGTKCLV